MDLEAQAHAPLSDDVALARAIADRYMSVHAAESHAYDWGEGVLMAALVDLSRVTGVTAYRDYAQRWIDANVAKGIVVTTSDLCAPAIAGASLYRATCDGDDAQVAHTTIDFLDTQALRTDDGGINHFGASDLFGRTLWVDSLYMFGEVLVRWGEAVGDVHALGEYGSQYKIFASHLQDDSGFFMHAYANSAPTDPSLHWARGNGWAITSGYDYLRVARQNGTSDDTVASSLARLAIAIEKSQDPSGLFWTIVDRPKETYLETSGTALFAAGLARGRRLGLLGAEVLPVVQRAIAGLRTRLKNDAMGRPIVTGTSGPTDPGHFQQFASVPLVDDIT
jgi:unsaturated rhamnogalacturonyl hydrolase